MRKYFKADGYKWDKEKADKEKRAFIEFRKKSRIMN